MTENMKRFMELVSQESEEYIGKLNKADRNEIIALAAGKGITLTDDDFAPSEAEGEVSLDEADVIAGGGTCVCLVGGGGTGGGNDSVCACVAAGFGYGTEVWNKGQTYEHKEKNTQRCFCPAAGGGKTFNN